MMIGRDTDVQRVRDVLTRCGACTVVGPGGVGKTTLVSALVDPIGDRAMLIDTRTLGRVDQVLAELALRLDVDHIIEAADVDVARVCAVLAQHIGAAGIELLAFDHVDKQNEAMLAMLTVLADRLVDVEVVVATRHHPVAPFGEVVRLRPLDLGVSSGAAGSAGATLFSDTFVRAGGDASLLAQHPGAVQRVLASTGGLPLAIIVVASRAALIGLPPSVIDGEPSDDGIGDALGTDVVGKMLEQSLDDLDASARRVFETVGTFRSDPSVAHIAAVAGLDRDAVALAVEQLARRSLVDIAGDRVVMLPPVRQLADHLAALSGGRALFEERHVHWAQELSRADPPPSTSEVLAVQHDLIRAIAASFDEDQLDNTIAIAKLLDNAFRADLRHRRRLDILLPVLRACREASTTEPGNAQRIDAMIETMRLTAMAHADATGSSAATGLLDEATTLVDRSSHRDRHLARIESLRAGLYFEAGDLDDARRAANRAIASARDAGDELARYKSIKLLADVALESGDLEHALDLSHEVIRDAPESFPWLKAYALATVGACELERGAFAVTITAAQNIARAAKHSGDMDLMVEADWLMAMADPQRAPDESIQLDRDRQGNSVIHIQADIANALRQLAAGVPDSAITLAADCELRATALPMRPLTIDSQLLVGAAAVELGAIAEANRAFRAALTGAVGHRFRLRVPDALDGLADVIAGSGGENSGTESALRGAAAEIRSQLGAVARPRPWRMLAANQLRPPPTGWVESGELTDAGLTAVVRHLADPVSDLGSPTGRLVELSPAERVIADLVADGHTNREIGQKLYVSRRTVETHIAHAFQKLHVTSRTQLAAIVLAERPR